VAKPSFALVFFDKSNIVSLFAKKLNAEVVLFIQFYSNTSSRYFNCLSPVKRATYYSLIYVFAKGPFPAMKMGFFYLAIWLFVHLVIFGRWSPG